MIGSPGGEGLDGEGLGGDGGPLGARNGGAGPCTEGRLGRRKGFFLRNRSFHLVRAVV